MHGFYTDVIQMLRMTSIEQRVSRGLTDTWQIVILTNKSVTAEKLITEN